MKFFKKYYFFIFCLLVIIAIGLLFRISVFFFVSNDYRCCIGEWLSYMQGHGGIFSLKDNFSDYTVPYLFLLSLLSYLPRFIFPMFFTKSLSVLFDFVLATVVYKIVYQKHKNITVALLSFGLVVLAPTVWVNSALWSQCDSIFTTFIILSLFFLQKRNTFLAVTLYALSFSFKLQAIFVLPLYIVLCLKHRFPIKYFLVIPIIYFLVSIPAILVGKTLVDVFAVYSTQITEQTSLVLNAPTIYQLIPVSFLTPMPHALLILCGGIVLFIFSFFILKHNKVTFDVIIKLALFYSISVPFLLPRMHERYFYIADIMSIIYVCYFKSKVPIPLLIVVASFSSYLSALGFANIDLTGASIEVLFVLIILFIDLYRPANNHFPLYNSAPPS
jgi:Gpi18-like mannosyltransferase